MPDNDELLQLRRDLDTLLAQAREIAQRLDQYESQHVVSGVLPPAPAPQAKLPSAPAPAPARQLPPPLPPAPTPRHPTAPLAPRVPKAPAFTLGGAARKAYAAIGPKEPMTWEMALGTYWLPRLAVLLLSIGVVWGLTLAVQKWGQEWLPYIRVAAGYAIATGLFLGGKFIEHRRRVETQGLYVDYARVMMAAGLALLYFVTYATHYIPFTRIIPRPEITLCLLSGIVLWWGFVAHLRRSWNLAFIVTVLGHFTVGLSTLTLDQPPRLAVLGLLVLSIGAAFFVARHGWHLLGVFAIAGSYGNYYLWLANSPPSGTVAAFAVAMSILAAYWFIYAFAEFLAAARGDAAAAFRVRNLYVALNSGGVLALGWGLTESFDFSRAYSHVFLFAFAAVLLAFGLLYLARRNGDVLYGAYITKASAVAALGLADYFQGAVLTFSLAVEMVVLLYSARRSGLLAPRGLALLLGMVAFAQGVWVAGDLALVRYNDAAYLGQAAAVAATLVAYLYASVFYLRTRWDVLDAAPTPWDTVNEVLYALNFTGRQQDKSDQPAATSPALVPNLFAFAGVVLALCHAHTLFPSAHVAAPAALAALVIAVAGVLLNARPLVLSSLVLTGASLFWWHRGALYMGQLTYGDTLYFEYLLVALLTLLPLLLLSELGRITRARGVWWRNAEFGYVIAAAEVFIFGVILFAGTGDKSLPLMIAAAGAGVYALAWGASNLGLASIMVFFAGTCIAAIEIMIGLDAWQAALSIGLAAVVALLSEQRWLGLREGLRFHQKPASPYFLYGAFAGLAALYIQETAPPVPGVYLLFAAAGVAVLLLHLLHERAWTTIATALFVWAALDWFSIDMHADEPTWNFAAWAIALGAAAAGRYLTMRRAFLQPVAEAVLITVTWAVLMYLAQVSNTPGYDYAAWLLLALALLVYGGSLRIMTALALSLFTAVIATLAGLIDAYDTLAEFPRAAMFACAILYWFTLERGHAAATCRGVLPAQYADIPFRVLLVGLPPLLLVVLLERVPLFASFYLTIAWTFAAVLVMLTGVLTREPYYRYAALSIFTLALGRLMLIDTQQLEAIYRIMAVIFLGLVLLAVGYGYIKAREKGRGVPAVAPSEPHSTEAEREGP